ncbi:MAG: hypothetical protein JSW47_08385 [Phycisphaerales bacterium]|nr:MAG: hypothetical protein JSW47_08385 [Phycisphaerales bacterium]
MEKFRGIILLLAVAAVATVACLPCRADEKKEEEKSIFTQDDQRRQRLRRWRPELTEEETNRVLESLKKNDPESAKELLKLRGRDPEEFKEELRRRGGEEYQKIVREHGERWRQQRLAEFLEWLKKNYRRDSRELESLKSRNPELYQKKLDALREKYGPIRDAERRNPELAVVLKEDLRLKERRNELIAKIKTTKKQNDKRKLIAELQDVVGGRYELILRRKQIEYERLLRWLERLQNHIKNSKVEIEEAKKKEIKAENIRQRMKTLLEGKKGFTWD